MKMSCNHPMIELDYIPQAFEDTEVLMLSISARCRLCGPLRFIGIDEGLSSSQPSTSTDALVVRMPVIPEFDEIERKAALRLAS